MKEIVFSSDSWHFWLAEFPDQQFRGKDVCSYVRSVMRGIIILILISAICILVSVPTLTALALDIWFLFHTYAMPVEFVGGLFIAGNVLLVFAFVMVASFYIAERKRKRKELEQSKPDGFIKTAYKSFKDKVCYQVRIE